MTPSRSARDGSSGRWQLAAALLGLTLSAGCGDREKSPSVLTAEVPLHLEEHLDAATLEGSELPEQLPAPLVWRFDHPQPEWQPVGYARPDERLPGIDQLDDAVRLTLSAQERPAGWRLPHGGLYIDVPDWKLEDWAYVIIELRNSDPIDHLELGVNLRDDPADHPNPGPFETWLSETPVIDDGSTQRYVARLDRFGENPPQGAWRQLGVYFGAREPVSADLLSLTLVPKEADYASEAIGVRMTEKRGESRRAIYTHGDAQLEYRVTLPEAARLDFGLAVLRELAPVRFRVVAARSGAEPTVLLDEVVADPGGWTMRSVDLSRMAEETVTLTLETETDPGIVGLWGSPVLSGGRPRSASAWPNVIFYVIDGGGADYMSLLGYNRGNTPELERLAEQGALFERAYSSATWTKPSTASFMTSLPHSALGGYRGAADRVPEAALTMAEILHSVGYQAAVIVSNPNAASLSGLERGADYLIETGIEPNNSESSRLLHEAFWRWREDYPTEPYWVHFQTTDIHEPFRPVPPFSGLYVDPELRQAYEEWDPKLFPGGGWRDPAAYEKHGIDRARYAYAQQGLYDEGMAHNDFRIGELVAQLRERGEWERTLLIVAADHGYPAACHRLMEPLAPMWGPMFTSHDTHVPLLFIWPERIEGGRRFTAPVSMLDVLPTLLELLDLPVPESAQGNSLAPLLLREGDWEPQPVILDEFYLDEESGELQGLIEVIDGRWGASLEIGEGAANEIGGVGTRTDEHRPAPLLLYDLRSDPFTLNSLHEERPDLVQKYTRLLERRWMEHLELKEKLGEGGQVTVDREQLEALRALGYIN